MNSDNRSTGFQGEELASRYLIRKGYTILSRNWRSPHGGYEIDIVARKDDIVVFFEVKTARTAKFGPSITWVTPHKTKHIAKAAEEFIASHILIGCSFRFDVIGIESKEMGAEIIHLENAFTVPDEP